MRKFQITKEQQEKCLDSIHDARLDGRNFASELRSVRNALVFAGQHTTATNVEGRIHSVEMAIDYLDRLQEFIKSGEII